MTNAFLGIYESFRPPFDNKNEYWINVNDKEANVKKYLDTILNHKKRQNFMFSVKKFKFSIKNFKDFLSCQMSNVK